MKKLTSLSYQHLRARPERTNNEFLLRDHLLNTQTKGNVILELSWINSRESESERLIDYATRSTLVKIIAGSHDVGKASRFFQDYVNPPYKNTGKMKVHSPISALYAFFVTRKLLSNDPRIDILSTVATLCVLAHHTRLESPSKAARTLRSFLDVIPAQMDAIDETHLAELDAICELLEFPSFSEFKEQWESTLTEFVRLQGTTSYNRPGLDLYYATNDLFSILIDADRLDAAELDIPDRKLLPTENIANNIGAIQDDGRRVADPKVLGLRDTIFRIAKNKSETVSLDQRLFSLTAPTGAGKTLSAFYFALKLRERRQNGGQIPRIIYVAPFLSVIDQNLGVLRKALGELAARSDIILAHHHLCEMIYRGEDLEYSTDKSILLVEGWNTEIVVTTFVQFLYTILGKGSKELRKLHNIYGSIVILDEVQTIPVEYWNLVHHALRCLTESYDVTFVLTTATQPLIFDRNEIVEVISDYKEYFKESFSKLDISCFKSTPQTQSKHQTIAEFTESVIGLLRSEAAKDNVMIVVNTIFSATQIFGLLDGSISSHELRYLSAEVTPKERLERLESIKKQIEESRRNPIDSKPVLLVTTQLVEAGVDIDFDMVIRDLAPIDSIIQCAGRCNRNGMKPREESVVKVVKLVDENGKAFARKIYGNISIQKTEELLSKWDPSGSLGELSNIFYTAMSASRSQLAEQEILKGISALDYDKLDNFKLIEERPGGSVFIELDDHAAILFKKYTDIWKRDGKRGRAMEEFLKIRSDFYQYVINVPEQYLSHLGEPVFGIYRVSRDNLHDLYDARGFVRNPQGIV